MNTAELLLTWVMPIVGFALALQILLLPADPHGRLWSAMYTRFGAHRVRVICRRIALTLTAGIPLAIIIQWLSTSPSVANVEMLMVLVYFANLAALSLIYVDKELWNALMNRPEQLPKVIRNARIILATCMVLLGVMLWLAWSEEVRRDQELRRLEESLDLRPPIWKVTQRTAASLRANAQYDLHMVGEHLNDLFRASSTSDDLLIEVPNSHIVWQRWSVLDDLVYTLCRHAALAAERRDWLRCRRSLSLALLAMKRIAELPLPKELRKSPLPKQASARLDAVSHVVAQQQILQLQLYRIASISPAHRQSLAGALQQGEHVRVLLTAWTTKTQQILRRPSQSSQQQITQLLHHSLPQLLTEFDRWQRYIDEGIESIGTTPSADR